MIWATKPIFTDLTPRKAKTLVAIFHNAEKVVGDEELRVTLRRSKQEMRWRVHQPMNGNGPG